MKRWFSDIRHQEIGHGPCLAPGEFSGVLRGWGPSRNLVVSLNQEDRAEDSGRQNLQSRGLGRRQLPREGALEMCRGSLRSLQLVITLQPVRKLPEARKEPPRSEGTKM